MSIDKVLQEMGFSTSFTEHRGIYVMGEGDERVFLTLYVDDLKVKVWSSKKSLVEVKQSLKELFVVKDLSCC